MRNHRITIPYFRTCSTCMSHSQAPLCYYTLRTIATVLRVPLEASVTLLEATTPVKLPTIQCPAVSGLGPHNSKGGISRVTPQA